MTVPFGREFLLRHGGSPRLARRPLARAPRTAAFRSHAWCIVHRCSLVPLHAHWFFPISCVPSPPSAPQASSWWSAGTACACWRPPGGPYSSCWAARPRRPTHSAAAATSCCASGAAVLQYLPCLSFHLSSSSLPAWPPGRGALRPPAPLTRSLAACLAPAQQGLCEAGAEKRGGAGAGAGVWRERPLPPAAHRAGLPGRPTPAGHQEGEAARRLPRAGRGGAGRSGAGDACHSVRLCVSGLLSNS